MVVGHRECLAVVSQHDVEDLAHLHRRTVNRANCHDLRVLQPIRGVTYEDQDMLAPLMGQPGPGNRLDVSCAPNNDRRFVGRRQLAEPQGSHDRDCLSRTNPRVARQLFGSPTGQLGKATSVRQKARRDVERVGSASSVSNYTGQQLASAERIDAERKKSLPRSFVRRQPRHRHTH
jgi:hypothetical protein